MYGYLCSINHTRDLETGTFFVGQNLGGCGLWITMIRGWKDGGPGMKPQKNYPRKLSFSIIETCHT